jgi:hypothetical protein
MTLSARCSINGHSASRITSAERRSGTAISLGFRSFMAQIWHRPVGPCAGSMGIYISLGSA